MAANFRQTKVVASPAAVRACHLSGIAGKLTEKKLIRLRDIQKALEHSIREVSAAKTRNQVIDSALISVRLVKIACDLTVAVLGEITGPGGKGVSDAYDNANFIIDGLNGLSDGSQRITIATEGSSMGAGLLLDGAGKAALGTALGAVTTLVLAGASLRETYDEYKSAQTSDLAQRMVLQTLSASLARVRGQVADVVNTLDVCGLPT